MRNIALNRLNIITIAKGEGLLKTEILTFLSELSALGYRITNPELLEKADRSIFKDYHKTIKILTAKRGGNVKYVPLFLGFPNKVPHGDAYFSKRIIGYAVNYLGMVKEGVKLENDLVVPEWLFDLKEFGADPITQFQDKEIYKAALNQLKSQKKDSHTEWIDLTLAYENEAESVLEQFLLKNIYAKSSIKEVLHADIIQLLKHFGTENINPVLMTMKETQAFVLKSLWENDQGEALKNIAQTPTDLLRLFAALTETDISLGEKIKFPKFARRHRRWVLEVLEKSANLLEDLNRYRGLWIELGRYIHPSEYKKRYPKTIAAFDTLRNGKVITYNSLTEKWIKEGAIDLLINHLSQRAGILGRKIHELLRCFPNDHSLILKAFEKAVEKMTLKNLLVLESYFKTINESAFRTIVNKKGRIVVVPNNARNALTKEQLKAVLAIISPALLSKTALKGDWTGRNIWIDPDLRNYTVPLQQRKASDGILTIGRGSQIKVDFDKVLRLFIYWEDGTKTTDLDLSIIQFDEDFVYAGHVSYTELSDEGIVHSGDITSAPIGAAEFIDISLKAVKKEVRYLAMQVYKYDGNNFSEIISHAGWMMRKAVTNDIKTFDIKTVVNKFDINGKGSNATPLIVDLKTETIIFTDLYVSGDHLYNNVEGSVENASQIGRELARFTSTRPNMYRLAKLHQKGRNGQKVKERELSDITFGLKNCDYNVSDIETILSELI